MKKPILLGLLLLLHIVAHGQINISIQKPLPAGVLTEEQLYEAVNYESLDKALQNSDKVYKLSLGFQNLSALPEDFWQLTHLQVLDLAGNPKLNYQELIPKIAKHFKYLQVLGLNDNQLRSLPPETGTMGALFSTLEVSRNPELNLEELFVHLKKLKNFSELNIGYNKLKTLPVGLFELPLEKLYLTGNPDLDPTQEFPKIAAMKKLNLLGLGYMGMNTLPAEIGLLQNVERLGLEFNGFTSLNAEICSLKKLQVLSLKSCLKLTSLHDQIGTLPKLNAVDLEGCPSLNLEQIFAQLKSAKKLAALSLNSCGLQTLPASIGDLSLGLLNINHNPLKSMPKEISKLRYSLKELNIEWVELNQAQFDEVIAALPLTTVNYGGINIGYDEAAQKTTKGPDDRVVVGGVAVIERTKLVSSYQEPDWQLTGSVSGYVLAHQSQVVAMGSTMSGLKVKYEVEKHSVKDNKREAVVLPLPKFVIASSFSVDGSLALIADYEKKIHLLDLNEKTETLVLPGHPGTKATNVFTALALSPNKHFAVSTLADGQSKLWNLQNAQEISTWTAPLLTGIAFSPDSKQVVYSLKTDKKAAKTAESHTYAIVLDAENGSEKYRIEGTEVFSAQAVTFQNDSILIIGGSKGKLVFWDLIRNKKLSEIQGYQDSNDFSLQTVQPAVLCVSPDGRYLGVAYNQNQVFQIWKHNGSAFELALQYDDPKTGGAAATSMSFSPDCKYIILNQGTRLAMWEVERAIAQSDR